MRRRPFGIRPVWGLMRCRLFGVRLIRLICRLRQWWLSGALRVGQCSCVGWRWFGGFVCVRGQLVDHGIAPERWVQRPGYHRIHCRRNFSHRLCNLPTEIMRPTEIARWSQLTIRSSSPAPREGKSVPASFAGRQKLRSEITPCLFHFQCTNRDNVALMLNRPIIRKRFTRSFAHGNEPGSALFRQARGRAAFHGGSEFTHVRRRNASREGRGASNGLGNFESHSNNDSGRPKYRIKGHQNMIRKTAIQFGTSALLVCMALNAYLAVNRLRQMQNMAALTLQSSMIQASISGALKDLTDM